MLREKSAALLLEKCSRTLTSSDGSLRDRLCEAATLLREIDWMELPSDMRAAFNEVRDKLGLNSDVGGGWLQPKESTASALELLPEHEILRVTYLVIGLHADLEKRSNPSTEERSGWQRRADRPVLR